MEERTGAYQSGLAVARGVRLAVFASLGTVGVAIVGLFLVFWDEVLFAGPIIILVKTLGFWPGYIAFVVIWTSMNVTSLALFDRIWPRVKPLLQTLWRDVRHLLGMRETILKEGNGEDSEPARESWRMRVVLATSTVFRPLGAVSVGLLLGGPFGAPMYRFLGYHGLSGYLWTIALCPIFGIIWVPIYGAGGVKIIDLLADAF